MVQMIRRFRDVFIHNTKRDFFAGIIVLIPLYVAYWLGTSLFFFILNYYRSLPQQWKPDYYLGPESTLLVEAIGFTLVAIFAFFLISFIGWVSQQYLGLKALNFVSYLIKRIPILGTLYSTVQQLLKTVSSGKSEQFRRVVYIQYPRKGTWVIAFVTGEVKHPGIPKDHVNVFVPTVPNPTSGFHLMVSKDETRESGLTVEQAFKTILSLGMADPHS